MLVATNAEKLATVEADIKAINPNVQLLSVATNMADAASVANLFAAVKTNFGHADILVNNAGVSNGNGVLHEQDIDAWWSNFVREPPPLTQFPIPYRRLPTHPLPIWKPQAPFCLTRFFLFNLCYSTFFPSFFFIGFLYFFLFFLLSCSPFEFSFFSFRPEGATQIGSYRMNH